MTEGELAVSIASICLTTLTALLSLVTAILAYLNSKRTSQANVELQIRTMISDAKFRHLEAS